MILFLDLAHCGNRLYYFNLFYLPFRCCRTFIFHASRLSSPLAENFCLALSEDFNLPTAADTHLLPLMTKINLGHCVACLPQYSVP